MLFQTSLLISAAALLSYVHCAPASNQLSARGWKTTTAIAGCALAGCYDSGSDSSSNTAPAPYVDPGAGPTNPAQITCTAGNPTAVADFANNEAWVGAMGTCLVALNVPKWVENQHCAPPQGPSFRFYSKGKNWDSQTNCFTKCSPCLSEGIDGHKAVSTYCRYQANEGSWCELGFWYNE